MVGSLGKVLWVLMGSIGVVLLIACANVANLLLVRAEGRQQELAVRAAIGASWGRLAGTLLMESVLLGLLGGVAGLFLAYGALRLLLSTARAFLPRVENITIDPAALLFTLARLGVGRPAVRTDSGGQVCASDVITAALRAGGRTLSQGRERIARATLWWWCRWRWRWCC